jgi:hypothetical protein
MMPSEAIEHPQEAAEPHNDVDVEGEVPTVRPCELITFYVGRETVRTTEATLRREPRSLLSRMLDDPRVLVAEKRITVRLMHGDLEESVGCAHPSSRTYFVDYNPTHFAAVIDHLRGVPVHRSEAVRRAAEALGVESLVALCQDNVRESDNNEKGYRRDDDGNGSDRPNSDAVLSDEDRGDLLKERRLLSRCARRIYATDAASCERANWMKRQIESIDVILLAQAHRAKVLSQEKEIDPSPHDAAPRPGAPDAPTLSKEDRKRLTDELAPLVEYMRTDYGIYEGALRRDGWIKERHDFLQRALCPDLYRVSHSDSRSQRARTTDVSKDGTLAPCLLAPPLISRAHREHLKSELGDMLRFMTQRRAADGVSAERVRQVGRQYERIHRMVYPYPPPMPAITHADATQGGSSSSIAVPEPAAAAVIIGAMVAPVVAMTLIGRLVRC